MAKRIAPAPTAALNAISSKSINVVAVVPDESARVVCGDGAGTLHLIDLALSRMVARRSISSAGILALAFVSDKLIWVYDREGCIKFMPFHANCELPFGEPQVHLRVHPLGFLFPAPVMHDSSQSDTLLMSNASGSALCTISLNSPAVRELQPPQLDGEAKLGLCTASTGFTAALDDHFKFLSVWESGHVILQSVNQYASPRTSTVAALKVDAQSRTYHQFPPNSVPDWCHSSVHSA